MAPQNQPETEVSRNLVLDDDTPAEAKAALFALQDQIHQDPALHTESILVYSTDPELVMSVVGLIKNHPDAVEKLEQLNTLFGMGYDKTVAFSPDIEKSLQEDTKHSKLIAAAQNASGDPETIEVKKLRVRASRLGGWIVKEAEPAPAPDKKPTKPKSRPRHKPAA